MFGGRISGIPGKQNIVCIALCSFGVIFDFGMAWIGKGDLDIHDAA